MSVDWIHLAQKYGQVTGSCDYGNETSDSTKYGNLFTSRGTVSFSRNSLLHAANAGRRGHDVSRLHEWELKVRNVVTATSVTIATHYANVTHSFLGAFAKLRKRLLYNIVYTFST